MVWAVALIGISWLLGIYILFHVPLCRASSRHSSYPRMSVIIPCRNEEKNIVRLLQSLNQQTLQPDEIMVVDDHSEDDTARAALNHGAKVIPSPDLPPGWLGKSWACQQGAEQATGDVFIFLDADTWFEKQGLRRLMDTFLNRKGVLSVAPYHVTRSWFEQGSAFFTIMQTAGMNAFTPLGQTQPQAGLFGPCLMISRVHYQKMGGHGAVKDKILEHYKMAAPLAKAGIPVKLRGGRGTLNVRMYPEGLGQMIQGWSKSFASGAGQTPPGIMLPIILWISGMLVTPLFLIFAVVRMDIISIYLWATAYILFFLQLYWHLWRIGRFKWYTSLMFPVPLILFFLLFSRSSSLMNKKRQVVWKGRVIKK